MSKADERHDITVDEYIASISDEPTRQDTRTIFEIMRRISGEEPVLYGIGTIGFGVYDYKYDSGHKGDTHILGFYPRKGKITVYLADGTTRHAALLAKLGKHTITGYCVYIKQLSDIELSVLEEILERSYSFITSLARSGPIDRILWQTEK